MLKSQSSEVKIFTHPIPSHPKMFHFAPSDDLFNLFVILDDLYLYGQVLFFPVNVYSFGINNFQKVKIFRSILIFLNYSCHFQHFLLNFYQPLIRKLCPSTPTPPITRNGNHFSFCFDLQLEREIVAISVKLTYSSE